ncbi:MAG: hypothetical protein LBD42_04680 [Desulfovibrio sp.]|jgi:hypothetical protein|nr:hypothetical protein [Desulfovibrio sp.]
MILDYDNMFSKDQAVTATSGSTSTVDLGPGDAGPSERVSLFVTSSTPFTGTGSLAVELHTSNAVGGDGSLTSPATIASYAVVNSKLTAGGKLLAARLPHGCKRYLRLNYVVTGTIAAGKITSCLAMDVQADMPDPVTAM